MTALHMTRTVSHYEIFEKIGEGGMGVVYRARDMRLDRFVALKMLSDEKFPAPGVRERLLREARTASVLTHPNIVTIYEVESIGDSHLIAMEYVKGKSLAQILAAGQLTLEHVLQYAIQIADGIAKAHESGIIHRDLKPGNIMVADDGVVKILDFGLAKRFDHPSIAAEGRTRQDAITDSRILIGTVAYMSPEQSLGQPPDRRSDIFSFGVMLFELLTGTLPFQAETPLATLQKIRVEPTPKVTAIRPAVPEKLEGIVEQALQKGRAHRFQNMKEIAESLRAVLAGITGAVAVSPATPVRLNRKTALVAVLGSLALFVALRFGVPDPVPASFDPATTPAQSLDASEWTSRGREYLARYDRPENIERAIATFTKAVERDGRLAAAQAGLAEAYARKNALTPDPQWARLAAEASRKAVDLDAHLATAHIARGMVLLQAQQTADAEAELNRARELEPGNASAAMWLAETFFRKKDVAKAEEHYGVAVALNPNDWSIRIYRGLFYYRQSDYTRATADFERANELSGDNILVLRNLAAAYYSLDRANDAASIVQRSLEVQPSAGVYNNLATIRFYQGRYEDAAAAFEKAVNLNSTTHLYWGNLADAHRWIPGNEGKSKAAYERAIHLVGERLAAQPGDSELLSYLALYSGKSGNTKGGLDSVHKLESAGNRSPNTFFKSAVVYEISRDRASALRDLEIAIERGFPLKDVQNDPELASLRSDRDYQRLLQKFQSKPK